MKCLMLFLGLSVFISLLLLGACSVATTSSDRDIEGVKKSMVYFQDDFGICYASISTLSYGATAIISITSVPCEKLKENKK